MSETVQLDSQELLQLALLASAQGQTEEAILHTKQALKQKPDDPYVLYMLGGLHAELGLLSRATEEIGQAVALRPDLDSARLQLGILHVARGEVEEARETLAVLEQVASEEVYVQFARGMVELLEGRNEFGVAAFERGLELNDFDPALNRQMQRMLAVAREDAADATEPEADLAPEPGPDPHSVRRALLSRYEVEQEERS